MRLFHSISEAISNHPLSLRVSHALHTAAPFLFAVACAQCWGVDPALAALLSLALPVIWALRARTRLYGGAIWFAYYLTVSSDMIPEISIIYPETPIAFAVATWLACAAALSLPWILMWEDTRGQRQSPLRVVAAMLLSIIPPIGIIGWTNPLLSSGLLFPGMGLSGLALTFLVPVALIMRRWPAVIMASILVTTSLVTNMAFEEKQPADTWFGQNTAFGQHPDGNRFTEWFKMRKRLVQIAGKALDEGADVVVLPEMASGSWNSFAMAQWINVAMRAVEPDKGLVIGATAPSENGGFMSGVVVFDEEGLRFKNGRVPIPLGVWQPWLRHTAQTDWLGDGRFTLAGKEVALSICYEDFMVFTQAMALHSIGREPAYAVVSIANNWFGAGRKGTTIQDASVRLMGRLFNVPVIRAVNY